MSQHTHAIIRFDEDTVSFDMVKLDKIFQDDKDESIKIANKLGVPINLFPCLVLLPPLKKLSEEEKLIIPIKEISKEYFRNLFTTLKDIFSWLQD
jgi:hypothetical protein